MQLSKKHISFNHVVRDRSPILMNPYLNPDRNLHINLHVKKKIHLMGHVNLEVHMKVQLGLQVKFHPKVQIGGEPQSNLAAGQYKIPQAVRMT